MYSQIGEEEDAGLPVVADTTKRSTAKKLGAIAGIIAALIVVIAGVAITVGAIAGAQKLKTQYAYGLMIDAGSTGTRAHLYRWPAHSPGGIPIIDTKPSSMLKFKLKPGLSTIKISDIPKYIGNLTSWALENVPAQKVPETPVFLKATAGMRTLPEAEQEERLKEVREALRESRFMFKDDSWATVIGGEEEGVFGWISTNYATGTLFDPAGKSHAGALDMGGSSTQITFNPKDGAPKEGAYNVSMPGLEYTLYTHSFLGFGVNDFVESLEDDAISKAPKTAEVVNFPCYLTGYEKKKTPTEYEDKKKNVTIKGVLNVNECKDLIREALKINGSCAVAPCSINGTYQPALDKDSTFYATGSYDYMGAFFGLSSVSKSSPKDLETKVLEYCALSWEEAESKYPSENEESRSLYCFEGLYDSVLLTEGYGFDAGEKRIVFADSVCGAPLGWTLGAMIYEASHL